MNQLIQPKRQLQCLISFNTFVGKIVKIHTTPFLPNDKTI